MIVIDSIHRSWWRQTDNGLLNTSKSETTLQNFTYPQFSPQKSLLKPLVSRVFRENCQGRTTHEPTINPLLFSGEFGLSHMTRARGALKLSIIWETSINQSPEARRMESMTSWRDNNKYTSFQSYDHCVIDEEKLWNIVFLTSTSEHGLMSFNNILQISNCKHEDFLNTQQKRIPSTWHKFNISCLSKWTV